MIVDAQVYAPNSRQRPNRGLRELIGCALESLGARRCHSEPTGSHASDTALLSRLSAPSRITGGCRTF